MQVVDGGLNDDQIEVFADLTEPITTTHLVSADKAMEELLRGFKQMPVFYDKKIICIEREKTLNLIRLTNYGQKLLPGENSHGLIDK